MSPAFTKPVPSCARIAENIEIEKGLPRNILKSISLVEAGRKMPDGSMRPWPWTLNHGGKSLFFDNKAAASKYLHENITKNYKNIDVGCMQVNVKWHFDRFNSFDDMLDPEKNMRYAGLFLSTLKKRHGSWDKAIKYYHSSTTKLNTKYFSKVKRAWNNSLSDSQIVQKASIDSNNDIIFPSKNESRDKVNLGFKDKKLADLNNSMIKYRPVEPTTTKKVEPLNAVFVESRRNIKNEKKAEKLIHYSKLKSAYLRKNIDMILLFRKQFAEND